MRKLLFALLALASLALIWNTHRAAAQTGAWADKLFGGQTAHDFGTVPRGAQLKYTFKITNIYKVPLEITNVRVTCGCVTATPSTKILQPNETAQLHINMDGTRFSGHKTVTVYVTVGPEYISTATLRISANARLDVVFNPGEIDFGLVHKGDTPTRYIDVEYAGALNWQVSEIVKNANAPFDLKVEDLRQRGVKGYRIFATIKPDAPAGPFKQEILLKTNDSTSPVLTFNILGNVQATLQVTPAHVVLSGMKVGDAETRKIVVRGNRPFRILAIDGQGDGITAQIPDREAATQILEVRFQPTRPGDTKKTLTIRTSLDNESVTVLVEGTAIP